MSNGKSTTPLTVEQWRAKIQEVRASIVDDQRELAGCDVLIADLAPRVIINNDSAAKVELDRRMENKARISTRMNAKEITIKYCEEQILLVQADTRKAEARECAKKAKVVAARIRQIAGRADEHMRLLFQELQSFDSAVAELNQIVGPQIPMSRLASRGSKIRAFWSVITPDNRDNLALQLGIPKQGLPEPLADVVGYMMEGIESAAAIYSAEGRLEVSE